MTLKVDHIRQRFKSKLDRYSTVSSLIAHNPVRPSANNRNVQSSTMWPIVCSWAPQSQAGDSTNPHLCIRWAHLSCSVQKRFNNTQLCRRKSKPGGRTLGSTIRSPDCGCNWKKRCRRIWMKIPHRTTGKQPLIWTSVRTGGTSRSFCNSPVHEQWLLQFAFLVGRYSSPLTAIVIALSLQSQKCGSLCCSAVYRFCWCAHRSVVFSSRIDKCEIANEAVWNFLSACSPVCAT
jgi:hypothetical protein